ncbi:MAG: urate hydroxylase PuuD [Candidatus Azotimanducaceae bacterium]
MDMIVVDFLARWSHILFGITWIGLLYYFNFVQTEYFKEAEDSARVDAFSKLVPRALWYFRWAALLTFLTGLVMLGYRGSASTADIIIGSVLGTLMLLNVWGIIWRNQKIVIASNQAVAAGGEADPAAAEAAPKAALASRTNTLFSIPMLWFMVASAHMPSGSIMANTQAIVICCVIIAAIEVNAIYGKQYTMTTVKGVIASGLVLTVILAGILRMF